MPLNWTERIGRMHRSSGGYLDMLIVDPSDMREIDTLALGGDAQALRVQKATADMLNVIRAAPRRAPTLCSACQRPLRKSYSVVIAYANLDVHSDVIVIALCVRCSPTSEAIQRQAAAALRKYWPDTRAVPVVTYS